MTSPAVPEKPLSWVQWVREGAVVVGGVTTGVVLFKELVTRVAPWTIEWMAPMAAFTAGVNPAIFVGLIAGLVVQSLLANYRDRAVLLEQREVLLRQDEELTEWRTWGSTPRVERARAMLASKPKNRPLR